MGAATPASIDVPGARRLPLRDFAAAVVRDNWPLLTIPLLFVAAGLMVESALGRTDVMVVRWTHHWFHRYLPAFLMFYVYLFLFLRLPQLRHGRAGVDRIYREFRHHYLAPQPMVGLLCGYMMLVPFFSTFGSLKIAIPLIQPFAWDVTFMEWDRALHFGHHPWELLQPLFVKSVYFTRILDLLYTAWFFLLYAVPVWMAVSRHRRVRVQFFLSFLLTWVVLGTVLATLFSSAGPCYFARVVPGAPDPFAPLMEYLRANGPIAVFNQEMVWDAYATGNRVEFGGGISAMPSLHVAMAVLFALVGWRVHRVLGAVLWLYAAAVMIGSVHLGWHYAIDGYLSIPATIVIWKLAGRFLDSRSPSATGLEGFERRP